MIIGDAFSGAAMALMLKREHPEARVLIVEKAAAFDRKVGESFSPQLLPLAQALPRSHNAVRRRRVQVANGITD